MIRLITLLIAVLALAGCASKVAMTEANLGAHRIEDIPTSHYTLRAVRPVIPVSVRVLRVYIEGDGKAWITRTTPSSDPTPPQLDWMQRAVADPYHAVYLARPCQFVRTERCSFKVWTDKRFDQDVLQSFTEALDEMLKSYPGASLELIGYSGGGAISMMLAATRDDVVAVQTVAGNLDPESWVQWHHISPVEVAVSIRDYDEKLRQIPQRHYVGTEDRVIPPALTAAYIKAAGIAANQLIIERRDHASWSSLPPIGKLPQRSAD